MRSDDGELRRMHAEAYERYRRAMRRAWLMVGLRAIAGGAAALTVRIVAERLHWHVPLWAGIATLCAVAAVTGAWWYRDGRQGG